MPNYVAGIGPLEFDLMAVGEAPGEREDSTGYPFMGPAGELFDSCLMKAGVKRSEIYITNVSKYRPPGNDFSKLHLIGVDINKQIEYLWEEEIRKFKPKCILAIGNEALKAICGLDGILKYRGSILLAKDGVTKVVPTIHPAALFSRYNEDDNDRSKGGLEWTYLKLIEHDFARAVVESRTRQRVLLDRTLTVARNSLDVHRFFREYQKLDKAACDVETLNCVPVCVGFAFNKYHAISIPLISNINKYKLSDMGNNELNECWREADRQLRRLRLIGQNFKYDEYKLKLVGFGGMKCYSDTLIKTRVIFPELPEKYLHVISSIWTREPYYKSEGKEFNYKKSNPDQLFLYNGKDCAVEFEVDEIQDQDLIEMSETFGVPLVAYYYEYMMRKHDFYLRMENRGFRVDEARQKELRIRYTDMAKVVHDRTTEIVGHEVNVKSYPQMYTLLYEELKLKRMKKDPTSEDTIIALMANHVKKPGVKELLTDILEERRIRDQKSRYINFQPDYDGRCKTSYNISATETCRSSTSILNKPVRPKKIGLAFHTIAAHGRLAKDIKSMLVVDEKRVFIKADSEQGEARIVAVLCEDWELLQAFDTVDIHRRTAGLMFGYTAKLELSADFKDDIVDNLEKDGSERFCGKKVRHAGNYKMGKRRFMIEFNTDAQKFEINMDISEYRAGQMLELFHKASPKLESKFWADIKDAIDSSRVLIDPFGGPRVFNGRFDDELYKEGYANIPQRTIAHLVQGAALKVEDEIGKDADGFFIGEKHDELIMSVPENDWEPYARVLQKHMQAPIDFRTYCTLKRDYTLVIPCAVELSDTHYGDFRKVKLVA